MLIEVVACYFGSLYASSPCLLFFCNYRQSMVPKAILAAWDDANVNTFHVPSRNWLIAPQSQKISKLLEQIGKLPSDRHSWPPKRYGDWLRSLSLDSLTLTDHLTRSNGQDRSPPLRGISGKSKSFLKILRVCEWSRYFPIGMSLMITWSSLCIIVSPHRHSSHLRSEVLAVGARCHPVEQLFLDDLKDQLLGPTESFGKPKQR